MDDLLPLETVTERDVDLLLLEEICVSPTFSKWLLSQASVSFADSAPVKAWHSVSDPELGESDLVIRVGLSDSRAAVLIENKIDASAQPDQASRYRARGKKGIETYEWNSFCTMIVAPKKYLESDGEASLYDAKVSYESIADWFSSDGNDPRRVYKAALLAQAIDQNRRGYNPKMDPRITKFFHDYWQLAVRLFPELNTEDPGARTASSSWISFRPDGLPRGTKIWHKIDYDQVDLELPFAAAEVESLRTSHGFQLPPDVQIVARGKSSGLRIEVPHLDRLGDLGEQTDKALVAMKAAIRLSALINVFHRD